MARFARLFAMWQGRPGLSARAPRPCHIRSLCGTGSAPRNARLTGGQSASIMVTNSAGETMNGACGICVYDCISHWAALRDSSISALISSIVHARSPFEKRSALPRSNDAHASCPALLAAWGWTCAPIMNGMDRVRTTCLRNAVNAFVIVSPSSSKTSSHCFFSRSSIRNVVVIYVSMQSF